jgi:hypothetical protein
MSSVKQIGANLANARRSTGPRTSAGKARSRMNAWKHGLTAEKVVIPGEDAEQLKAIRRELWEEYEPLPGMESLIGIIQSTRIKLRNEPNCCNAAFTLRSLRH